MKDSIDSNSSFYNDDLDFKVTNSESETSEEYNDDSEEISEDDIDDDGKILLDNY